MSTDAFPFTDAEVAKLAEAADLQYLNELALFRLDAPAAAAWEALAPEFKAQNVEYIRSLPRALSTAGLRVVRRDETESPLADDGAESASAGNIVDVLDDAELLVLAASEHERWCTLKAEQGYVFGDTIDEWSNPKTHSHLRSFDELDRSARNFPLTQASGIPALLALCRFGVVRTKE